MKSSFLFIAPADIDAGDLFFQIQPDAVDLKLSESVARLGILQPLWLQARHGGGYRLVSGFRRFRAAAAAGIRQIPALLLPESWDDLETYRWMVQEKSSVRPLNPLEASYAIAALQKNFHLEAGEIIQGWLPLMGLAPNPKLFAWYAPLCALEPELQAAIANDELGLEVASAVTAESPEERLIFWRMNQILRLGKNRQREFWLLLLDARRIRKKTFRQLLEDPACAALLENPNLTPSQKSDRIKHELMKWRYPQFSATLARFEALLQEAKLPPELHLRPSPWFAGEEFSVEFSFSSADEFGARLKVLQGMLERDLVAKMVQLT